MKINVASVLVDDQDKALKFYTEALGFIKKTDIPVGGAKWLTVVSPERPDGVELLLEPDGNPTIQINGEPAAQVFKRVLYEAGIPFTVFAADDLHKEYERMKELGVVFTMEPTKTEWGSQAIFDYTCGNLIMLAQEESS